MNVRHYSDPTIAVTTTDEDGPTVIQWGGDPSLTCDGYIVGGALFAPSNGDAGPGFALDAAGRPDPDAGWYLVATGQTAVVLGLDDAPLAVLL